MKLVAASKMRGDINRFLAAEPFGEIFTRLSTVPEDFEDSEETKSSNKTTLVKSSPIHLATSIHLANCKHAQMPRPLRNTRMHEIRVDIDTVPKKKAF